MRHQQREKKGRKRGKRNVKIEKEKKREYGKKRRGINLVLKSEELKRIGFKDKITHFLILFYNFFYFCRFFEVHILDTEEIKTSKTSTCSFLR